MLSFRTRRGSTATEYALIAALVGAVLVAAILNLGTITEVMYTLVQVMITAVM